MGGGVHEQSHFLPQSGVRIGEVRKSSWERRRYNAATMHRERKKGRALLQLKGRIPPDMGGDGAQRKSACMWGRSRSPRKDQSKREEYLFGAGGVISAS